MQKMWPRGDQHVPGLLEGIATAAPTAFPKYGLTTPLTVAQFMAQVSEECGAGLEMVEDDNFTAEQLVKLWPNHFTGTMAERLAHNPRMICDVAYGGRMGNAPPPSDDGYDYRGRGLTNCTGLDGYKAVAVRTGIDVMAHPEYFSDPRYALELGVADFVICGCLPYAEKDDVLDVTKKLNGGTNGLASREAWLKRWKLEIPDIGAGAGPVAQAPPQTTATVAAAAAVTPTSELMARIQDILHSGEKP
jgi:putative chitinase